MGIGRIFEEVEQDLVRLGTEVVTSRSSLIPPQSSIKFFILAIRSLSNSSRVNPPTLVQYDQWGRRIDNLQTSEGWRELKAISHREGLPGIFYERKYNEYSRTYGFAKVALLDGDTNEVCLLRLAPFMSANLSYL